jgi:hypothetical protein
VKLNPQVFIDAAERIDSRENGNVCSAVIGATVRRLIFTRALDPYVDFLSLLYGDGLGMLLFWEEDGQSGVLALLFCAAICEGGGL